MNDQDQKKSQCPDCYQCQSCGIDRCRICRKGAHQTDPSDLETGFTYRRYLEWKEKRKEGEWENTL